MIFIDKIKGRFFRNKETNNDKWVLSLLKNKKDGYFIEAGAWDGVIASSSYVLEKYYGWKGLLIEPGPAFLDLKKNRPKSICINKILLDKKSFEKFIVFRNLYGYNCTKENYILNQEKILKAYGDKDFSFEEINIETVPLADLLEEYNAPKIIDYLTLDIEGSEFRVLKNFPFEKYKIRCIAIEGSECDELLISKGYKKVNNKYNINAPWESYFIYDFD